MSEQEAREAVRAYIEENKQYFKDTVIYGDLTAFTAAHSLEIEELIRQAPSDKKSWEALEWIADHGEYKEAANMFFSKAARSGIKKPTKRGRNPENAAMRNWLIGRLVWKAKSAGLPEYSNGNQTKLTAVKLVSEELHTAGIYLDAGTITEIWKANPLK